MRALVLNEAERVSLQRMQTKRSELTNIWLEGKIKEIGLQNKVSFFIDIDHVTFHLKLSDQPKKEQLLALEKAVDEKAKYSVFQVDIHS